MGNLIEFPQKPKEEKDYSDDYEIIEIDISAFEELYEKVEKVMYNELFIEKAKRKNIEITLKNISLWNRIFHWPYGRKET